MLICFAMFCFWQMGFIYFVGPMLNIDGRTPLPMDMDNVTILIVLAYVLTIAFMAVIPQHVIWACRITTAVTLVSAIGLFLPLGEDALRLLIYAQVFGCCFMIGFESFIMINYFSEKSVITHLTVAYGVALAMISMVQNDFTPIAFPQFRLLTVIAVAMLLVFFCRMPAGKEMFPRYVTKNDGIMKPKKLLFGTYTLVFVSALMGVSGPAISGEIRHGVFITYAVDALVSLGVYLLYKKANIHPFRLFSICMGFGCVGFLLMFAAEYVPMLGYASAVLIGFGIFSCQMIPLYGMVLMKTYPSKYITSTIISLALEAISEGADKFEISDACVECGSCAEQYGGSVPKRTAVTVPYLCDHHGYFGDHIFADRTVFPLCVPQKDQSECSTQSGDGSPREGRSTFRAAGGTGENRSGCDCSDPWRRNMRRICPDGDSYKRKRRTGDKRYAAWHIIQKRVRSG